MAEFLHDSGHDQSWIWPWCAKLVAQFGKATVETAEKSLIFWRSYIREHPDHRAAELERLLCLWRLRSENRPTEIGFEAFKSSMLQIIEGGEEDAAFLWDRIGHWAQYDGKWQEAEIAYRKAYEIQPERYSYCFGTALNFLGRFQEALQILGSHVGISQTEPQGHFQVGLAHLELGNFAESIASFQRAVQLDEDYHHAWFNLGGAYWSSGDLESGARIWREAIKRFPEHERARQLFKDLPQIFKVDV